MRTNRLAVRGIASCEVLGLRNVARLIFCHQNSDRRETCLQFFTWGERGCRDEINLLPTRPLKHFEIFYQGWKERIVQFTINLGAILHFRSFLPFIKTEHDRREFLN